MLIDLLAFEDYLAQVSIQNAVLAVGQWQLLSITVENFYTR